MRSGEHTSMKWRKWYRNRGEVVPEKLRAVVEGKHFSASWEPSEPVVKGDPRRTPATPSLETQMFVKSVTGRKRRHHTEDEEAECRDKLTGYTAGLEEQAKEEVSAEIEVYGDEGSDEVHEEGSTLNWTLTTRSTISIPPRTSTSRSVAQEEPPKKRIKSCTGIVRKFRLLGSVE